ncbi:MAG: hypothetical protein WC622_11890 [Pedobacter sp.]|uniref:hypothetical protein n=1 Tax=Pedobacter sp. TaxID=1411316 RepID=UPI00356813C9
MKNIILALAIFTFLGCSESNQQKVDNAVSKTGDSLKSKLNKLNDTLREGAKDAIDKIPKVKVEVARTIPISLQWISFEEQGSAKISKADDGWYTLKGEQTNTNNEFLKIDGKITRVNNQTLKFVGTIITFVKSNNGSRPCEKTGEYTFLKKGDRANYRLQQMENCGGGRVVDYVDLYKLDDIL